MNTARNLHNTPFYANTGYGPAFSVLEVGIPDKVAVVEPDVAFWALVERTALDEALSGRLPLSFHESFEAFREEMHNLRFGLKPSAAYFNPTERCNFDCTYCYLPQDMRLAGKTMTVDELSDALERLRVYFTGVLPPEAKPQLIFHGSEPMLAREAVFAGIERFSEDFTFGIQTNATLLDDEAIAFLKRHSVGIGISLDAPDAPTANAARKSWHGTGGYDQVVSILDKLADYPAFNVITTVTSLNVHTLEAMVDFYHNHGVRVAMLNPVRVTQGGGRELKPDNLELAKFFCRALDRTHELYEETGRKIVIANFANVLAGIVGPTGRRLMCDISPCGGGRCFFAVSAKGDVFPCSEFIGFSETRGGNLFEEPLSEILTSRPFQEVTGRKVEHIVPCGRCAIRHFCGAPCPAEIKAASGTFDAPSPYCEFYEEQVRYAFRVISKGQEAAYLWDSWTEDTEETFHLR